MASPADLWPQSWPALIAAWLQMPPAPQSYLFIEETEDSTNHVDAYEAALEAVALEAIDKKIAPSGDAWTAKWEKVFATQIEAVRQSNEDEDELRIAEEYSHKKMRTQP